MFDYLIDIGKDNKQTGRLFGVEVKALNGKSPINKSLQEQYKNITFPSLLVLFDNKTDHGYFTWIKKPKEDGGLSFDSSQNNMKELNDSTLLEIVKETKDWYTNQQVA